MQPTAAYPKTILVGGAPKSGKSTLARLMAARLQYDLITTDDLATAARAVTSPSTHPGLHLMNGEDYREYYIARSSEVLWNEAIRMHYALWPSIRGVILNRSTWAFPAVIEGWHILPELFAADSFNNVAALWLTVADPAVFEYRTRIATGFTQGASNEEDLIGKFAGRSARFNSYLLEETAKYSSCVLQSGSHDSPEILCERALSLIVVSAGP